MPMPPCVQNSAPSISAARDGLGDSLHMARGQRPVAENPQAAGRTAESLPPRGGVQATNRLAAQTDQMADASDVLSDLEDAFN